MKKFMFMYILGDDIDRTRTSLGQHVTYWKGLCLDYFKNGPFADKSGGLIIFSAADTASAEKILAGDPLVTGHVVKKYWLKEWVA